MRCFWCDRDFDALSRDLTSKPSKGLGGAKRRRPVDLPAASCAGIMLRGSDGRVYRSVSVKQGRNWTWKLAVNVTPHELRARPLVTSAQNTPS